MNYKAKYDFSIGGFLDAYVALCDLTMLSSPCQRGKGVFYTLPKGVNTLNLCTTPLASYPDNPLIAHSHSECWMLLLQRFREDSRPTQSWPPPWARHPQLWSARKKTRERGTTTVFIILPIFRPCHTRFGGSLESILMVKFLHCESLITVILVHALVDPVSTVTMSFDGCWWDCDISYFLNALLVATGCMLCPRVVLPDIMDSWPNSIQKCTHSRLLRV